MVLSVSPKSHLPVLVLALVFVCVPVRKSARCFYTLMPRVTGREEEGGRSQGSRPGTGRLPGDLDKPNYIWIGTLIWNMHKKQIC